MGKSTEPPKCKVCGENHRGPCYPRPEKSMPDIVQVPGVGDRKVLTHAITREQIAGAKFIGTCHIRSGTEYICEVPSGTELFAFGGKVIAAGPHTPASIVTDDGLKPLRAYSRDGVIPGVDQLPGESNEEYAANKKAETPKKKRGRPRDEGPTKGKSKRAAYQRELMRKRLAAKAAKPKS